MAGKIKNINEYIQKDDHYELHIINKITNRQIKTLISNEDVEKVKLGNWCACYDKTIDDYYIRGRIGKQQIQLHRYITNCPKELQVDHINRNTTDNRRCNLRICTSKENNQNRIYTTNKFGETGINYHKTRKRFCVVIKGVNVGTFKTFDEAKQAKKLYLENKLEVKPKRIYNTRVRCLETNIVYNSISNAERQTGVKQGSITACCARRNKTAGGYHWEYVDKVIKK